ncbi:MAG: hypothetical protein FJ298_16110 [Planctomycetes bacterium]|nr:hypothetical protein [Planctomycetota bacterium]
MRGRTSRAFSSRGGTSAASFDVPTFIERFAALVPHPRAHHLTYHGVLAPRLRVARPRLANSRADLRRARSRSSRSIWAELLPSVFAVDVLTRP